MHQRSCLCLSLTPVWQRVAKAKTISTIPDMSRENKQNISESKTQGSAQFLIPDIGLLNAVYLLALRALISSIALGGEGSSDRLRKEQVLKLSERLEQILGDVPSESTERKNEKGEVCFTLTQWISSCTNIYFSF